VLDVGFGIENCALLRRRWSGSGRGQGSSSFFEQKWAILSLAALRKPKKGTGASRDEKKFFAFFFKKEVLPSF
jgi:hypothetical protein